MTNAASLKNMTLHGPSVNTLVECPLYSQTMDAMSTSAAGHDHVRAGPHNKLHLLLCNATARQALLHSTAAL